MSPARWAISCFLAWHLLALGIRALPPRAILPDVEARAPGADGQVTGTALTPALDRSAAALRPVALTLLDATAPIGLVSNDYLRAVGFAQHWRMFSLPPTVDQYARVRYYVRRTDRPPMAAPDWFATELIVPAHREDRVRLAASYLDSTRDKAIMVALENFHRLRDDSAIRGDVRPEELPDYVAPVVRYFTRRFETERLLEGERVVRSEFWYGIAPMAPPGSSSEPAIRAARANILERYYEDPVEGRASNIRYPSYLSREHEGDLTWILDYFEER